MSILAMSLLLSFWTFCATVHSIEEKNPQHLDGFRPVPQSRRTAGESSTVTFASRLQLMNAVKVLGRVVRVWSFVVIRCRKYVSAFLACSLVTKHWENCMKTKTWNRNSPREAKMKRLFHCITLFCPQDILPAPWSDRWRCRSHRFACSLTGNLLSNPMTCRRSRFCVMYGILIG